MCTHRAANFVTCKWAGFTPTGNHIICCPGWWASINNNSGKALIILSRNQDFLFLSQKIFTKTLGTTLLETCRYFAWRFPCWLVKKDLGDTFLLLVILLSPWMQHNSILNHNYEKCPHPSHPNVCKFHFSQDFQRGEKANRQYYEGSSAEMFVSLCSVTGAVQVTRLTRQNTKFIPSIWSILQGRLSFGAD